MASAALTTCLALPSRGVSLRRRIDPVKSKPASAMGARCATANDSSAGSKVKLRKADTMLGPGFESLQKGLEREVGCSNIGEDLIVVRRKDWDDHAITELSSATTILGDLRNEDFRVLAIGSLVFALVCLPDANALALGPGGPLMEEFWDNVRRYGFYFFTVVSGGLYSLAKPLLDLLKEPSTQFLVAIAVAGTLYLVYLTISVVYLIERLGIRGWDLYTTLGYAPPTPRHC